jgi:hypothetical protein
MPRSRVDAWAETQTIGLVWTILLYTDTLGRRVCFVLGDVKCSRDCCKPSWLIYCIMLNFNTFSFFTAFCKRVEGPWSSLQPVACLILVSRNSISGFGFRFV